MKKLFFLLILVFSYMLIRIDDCQAQALVRYAKNGNIDKVQELLNKGADTITLNDALWWAAGEGYIDIMKLLIEKGANVNYLSKKAYDLNKNHISVIGLATALGQFESIKFLLEHGADPNAGSCVICHAFSHYYDLTRGNTSTIEINNLIKTLKLLLDNGANPDKEYPILTAIRMNMIDVINLLIEHGADLKKPACLYIA
jgi:ankyrin repeat protein